MIQGGGVLQTKSPAICNSQYFQCFPCFSSDMLVCFHSLLLYSMSNNVSQEACKFNWRLIVREETCNWNFVRKYCLFGEFKFLY